MQPTAAPVAAEDEDSADERTARRNGDWRRPRADERERVMVESRRADEAKAKSRRSGGRADDIRGWLTVSYAHGGSSDASGLATLRQLSTLDARPSSTSDVCRPRPRTGSRRRVCVSGGVMQPSHGSRALVRKPLRRPVRRNKPSGGPKAGTKSAIVLAGEHRPERRRSISRLYIGLLALRVLCLVSLSLAPAWSS